MLDGGLVELEESKVTAGFVAGKVFVVEIASRAASLANGLSGPAVEDDLRNFTPRIESFSVPFLRFFPVVFHCSSAP